MAASPGAEGWIVVGARLSLNGCPGQAAQVVLARMERTSFHVVL